MAYKKVALGGDFFKFEVEGDFVEGEFQGTTDGTYGDIAHVKDDNGKVQSFGISAGLRGLEAIPTGTRIKVVYVGKKEMGAGKQAMKVFECFADDPAPF